MSTKSAPKWGSSNRCPVCDKTVYPNEQVFCEDRKPFHRSCIRCGSKGCSNNLRAGGVHRHDNVCVCDRCHTELYGPAKEYGPPPGKESIEERRLRMARVKQEYQQSLTEFSAAHREEEMKLMINKTNLKIAGLMDFAPEKAYTVRDNLGC